MKKFEWMASENAPRGYPMRLVGGSFIYDGGSQYIPSGSTLDGNDWGQFISVHAAGEERKPVPKKLAITFFSYLENQFYQGNFNLPYERILKLFQDGYYNPNDEEHTTYQYIVAGVAPGGAVSVWLSGYNRTTEVFHGTAEKVDLPWSALTSATHITREQYVREVIEETRGRLKKNSPAAFAALPKDRIPFGLWDSYRIRYPWQPLFTGMSIRDGRIVVVKYFNGEVDFMNYPMEKDVAVQARAVPRYMSFIWEQTPVRGRSVKLTFDETETLAAFKKLGTNNQPLKLEMKMEKVNGNDMFTVALRNDKERIEFDKIKVEHYAVDDRKPAKAK